MSWNGAFEKAISIEKEGAKEFADFFVAKRPHWGDEGDRDVLENYGGFRQPRKLSKFVKNLHLKEGRENNEQSIETSPLPCESQVEAIGDAPAVNHNVAKQICRTWLKHKYLGVGKPCLVTMCPRKHDIDFANPERLYSDYSFKGLSLVQRKKILKSLGSDCTNQTAAEV
jgi:hypothetical protein